MNETTILTKGTYTRVLDVDEPTYVMAPDVRRLLDLYIQLRDDRAVDSITLHRGVVEGVGSTICYSQAGPLTMRSGHLLEEVG